jgi:hypothetical protein
MAGHKGMKQTHKHKWQNVTCPTDRHHHRVCDECGLWEMSVEKRGIQGPFTWQDAMLHGNPDAPKPRGSISAKAVSYYPDHQ